MDLERLGYLLLGALVGVVTAAAGAYWRDHIAARVRSNELRRALDGELRENIIRIGDGSRAPNRIERSAWDNARGLPFAAASFAALAQAYAVGEDLNDRIGVVNLSLGSRAFADPGSEAFRQGSRHHDTLVNESMRVAERAGEAFEAARAALS